MEVQPIYLEDRGFSCLNPQDNLQDRATQRPQNTYERTTDQHYKKGIPGFEPGSSDYASDILGQLNYINLLYVDINRRTP